MSDVARVRKQIDAEIEAMNRAAFEYAIVSRHEIITHHFEMLGIYLEQLSGQVGAKAAIEAIMEELERQL